MKASTMEAIHALADGLDCAVYYVQRGWEGSHVDYGMGLGGSDVTARVPQPTTIPNALTVLHELGHVATIDQHDVLTCCLFAGSEERLEWEARSWEWAVENYPAPITTLGWAFIHFCLGTYADIGGTQGPAFRRLFDTARVESKGRVFHG